MERQYNLIPSGNDSRDFQYSKLKDICGSAKLPEKFYNPDVPVIFDQGSAGTCGWNALVYAMMMDNLTYKHHAILSRLYGYARTKMVDGISGQGVRLRDALDVSVKQGTCLEDLYPYSDSKEIINCVFPRMTEEMATNALQYRNKAYAKLNTVEECKNAIINEKGFLINLLVTDQYIESEFSDGVIGTPTGIVKGAHAMYIKDFDDNLKTKITYTYASGEKETKYYTGAFIGPNSYGKGWGDNGLFYIPYECFDLEKHEPFVYNLINEAWTVTEYPKEETVIEINEIKLKIGSKKAVVKGKEVTLDVAPIVVNDRTLVPLRFICEELGKEVTYDNPTETVTIKL